jgi:hypothetical protein
MEETGETTEVPKNVYYRSSVLEQAFWDTMQKERKEAEEFELMLYSYALNDQKQNPSLSVPATPAVRTPHDFSGLTKQESLVKLMDTVKKTKEDINAYDEYLQKLISQ